MISTRTRKRSRTHYAVAVNEEIKDLFAAGADIVQLDEPWMVSFADRARKYGIAFSTGRSRALPARPPCTSAWATPMW